MKRFWLWAKKAAAVMQLITGILYLILFAWMAWGSYVPSDAIVAATYFAFALAMLNLSIDNFDDDS